MTIDQFWYSTDLEVHAYEKAYYERSSKEAWLNGLYTYQAQSIALSNAFASKNSDKVEYPHQPISMFQEVKQVEDKVDKNKVLEDRDLEFRKKMMECY